MLFSMARRTDTSNENTEYCVRDVTQSLCAKRIPTT